MPRLVVAVTAPITARILLRGVLSRLRERGFEVWLMCGGDPAEVEDIARREEVHALPVPLEREIAPWADARALAVATWQLRRVCPGVVWASTPKAGLIAMMAARLARVPARIYQVRGLRLETARGPKRRLLRAAEKTALVCSTQAIAVSHSLRRRMAELRLAREEDIEVVGQGSSRGVDLRRFEAARSRAGALRAELGIGRGDFVVGFVGRLTRDKGIDDLRRAAGEDSKRRTRYLVLGEPETGDTPAPATMAWLRTDQRVRWVGSVDDPAPYYHLMSVLAFPSYREGFPNAPLEAAACRVPTAGYRSTGVVDSVVDSETGTLADTGDWRGLSAAIASYREDPALAQRHGQAAGERAEEDFDRELVLDGYCELLLRSARA